MPEIRKHAGEDKPVILVGTKQDLHEKSLPHEKIDIKYAERVAKEVKYLKFWVGVCTVCG